MKRIYFDFRIISAILHDACAILIAWMLAFAIRFNFAIPAEHIASMWLSMAWILPMQLCLFIFFGLYKGIWRFASTVDLTRILLVVMFGAVLTPALLLMFGSPYVVPRIVLLLYPVFLLLIMGGSRFAYRLLKEYANFGALLKQGDPVVILGAGQAAISLVKELSRSKQWRVVAMLDDDASIHKREILGVKVFGNLASLSQIYQAYQVQHVIIAMPSASHQKRRKAVELANNLNLEILTVPAIDDLMSGKVNISQIRKVDVEDLLGRDVVQLDDTGLQHLIEHNTVLVSGAGGSIGSELCRQILKYKPSRLVCFDISEYALYQLEQELQHNLTKDLAKDFGKVELIFVTGDVKNEARVKHLFSKYQPKVVFHAAAYKHVPLMETHNVAEALSNNVLGTYVMASASMQAGVEKFVLISTDKAVNPTNVMGASKRLAEMVCQSLEGGAKSKTHFVMVRFGNVLGSSGSVIPKFREQIAKGGPVTVTHPEITRYFMSIPEAAQLVIQAGLMGNGGEIFVLDMGEPVKIAELAKDMIRLSGFQHDEIKVVYTGLRPGEKLYEELLADDEHTQPTPHPKLRIAMARKADAAWVKKLLKWVESSQLANESEIKKQLAFWVEEYVESAPVIVATVTITLSNTLH